MGTLRCIARLQPSILHPPSSLPRFLALLVGCCVLYLVGNASVQLWDRDEPRYAQCSREMLFGSPEHPRSDFVVPRFLGAPRYAKPPLIYWLQAGAMTVFGDTAFAARFPSAVAMLVVLTIAFVVVRRVTDDERAVWTAFVLGTSVMALAAAKASLTDAVLLVFVLVAQCCAYAGWRGRMSWGVAIALGVSVGLSGLTKGPVVLGMIGSTLVALLALRGIDAWLARRGNPPFLPEGEGTGVRPGALITVGKVLLAAILVFAIVYPWIHLLELREPGFLKKSWSINVVDRIRSGSEGHSAPPGYYLVTIWGTYFPWCIFIPMVLVYAWKHRGDPYIRFALAAFVGPLVMLEVVQTKLPHYLLPAFPFLAFLTADAFVRCFHGEHDDLVRPSFVRFMRGWAVVVAVLGSAPWLLPFAWPGQSGWVLGPAAGIGVAHVVVTLQWVRGLVRRILITLIGLIVLIAIVSVIGSPPWNIILILPHQPWWALAAMSIVAVAYVVVVFRQFRAGRPLAGVFAMGAGMAAIVLAVFVAFLPNARSVRTSIEVAKVLEKVGATGPDAAGQVVMQDYKEPSLAFYQGGTIREWSPGAIDVDKVPRWLVTTTDVYDAAPDETKARFTIVDRVKGLAYADRGRVVEVLVLKKKD
jgi:4-amino-4-deoxy-L-arabinose transferase-like glycosyltransferase